MFGQQALQYISMACMSARRSCFTTPCPWNRSTSSQQCGCMTYLIRAPLSLFQSVLKQLVICKILVPSRNGPHQEGNRPKFSTWAAGTMKLFLCWIFVPPMPLMTLDFRADSLCAFLISPKYKAHAIPHSMQQVHGSPLMDLLGLVGRKQRKRWE